MFVASISERGGLEKKRGGPPHSSYSRGNTDYELVNSRDHLIKISIIALNK